MQSTLSIGELARRTGVATSALRFYEQKGLIASRRNQGNQRRYPRSTLRVVSVIRIAQTLGLTLGEIQRALSTLPDGRAPTKADWARMSRSWKRQLEDRIRQLTALRDQLDGCIGCGCLSLKTCGIHNASDAAARLGPGPRYLIGGERPPARS